MSSADSRRHALLANPALLFGSLLFGAIGLAAFVYGKKLALWKPMVIGIALMAYPYFISHIWLMYAIGIALCAALYVLRD
jgi:hypothetical protein